MIFKVTWTLLVFSMFFVGLIIGYMLGYNHGKQKKHGR